MAIDKVLEERAKTHGAFVTHAAISQELKDRCRSCKEWYDLSYSQQEALDMILHKIARIMNGSPDHVDHWTDIAGYATLVERELNAKL